MPRLAHVGADQLRGMLRVLILKVTMGIVPSPAMVEIDQSANQARSTCRDSIDAGGFHALCLAGGMYFPDRWVYFTTTINWEKDVDTDPATTAAYAAATARALARVQEALGS